MMANVCCQNPKVVERVRMVVFPSCSRSFSTLAPPSVEYPVDLRLIIILHSLFTYAHILYNYRMSLAAKLTLAGTSLGAVGIVYLVHHQQQAEKAVSIPKSTF